MASLAGAALWYAGQGHLVFPLKPGTKVPDTAHGFKDASMDPTTIRTWWRERPDRNIGLVTGHLWDVIDIDGEHGIRNIAAIEDNGQIPDIIAAVTTPRGFHLMIRPTGDRNATAIVTGIDYRGHGGYTVAPPSIVNGVTYRWTIPPNLT